MSPKIALLLALIATTIAYNDDNNHDNDNGDSQYSAQCSSFRNVRSINGTCNNLFYPSWGVSGGNFSEVEGYKIWTSSSPNERDLSNKLFSNTATKQDIFFNAAERRSGTEPDPRHRNQFFVAFGQFIAHDFGQNPLAFDFANIFANYKVQIIDPTDPLYEPALSNKTGILTQTSIGVLDGDRFFSTNAGNSFLDLGPLYGSTDVVSALLRSFQGGLLKTDPSGSYLPFDSAVGAPSECGAFRSGVSAAGDLRADENPVLTSVHTIFLREHNRLANQFASQNPSWNDEQIFQAARTELIALYQHVVFDEWLPLLLGPYVNRLGDYRGYKPRLDPTVGDTFSASAFRLMHDLVNLPVLVVDQSCNLYIPEPTEGRPTQEGSNCIPLFFRAVGLEAALRGSLNQYAQAQDHKFANGIRNVLLKASTRGGNLDIETANIFRGRDHQLLDFNSLRKFYTGKSIYEERGSRCRPGNTEDSIECFNAITSNSTVASLLKSFYKKVSNIDAYVGLAVEDINRPSYMPYTASAIILEQFDRTRSADRFWFENRNVFDIRWIQQIRRVKMADIIRRNTNGIVVDNQAFKVHDQCDWENIPQPAPLHARMQR